MENLIYIFDIPIISKNSI